MLCSVALWLIPAIRNPRFGVCIYVSNAIKFSALLLPRFRIYECI
jgi:hypothetical protein